MKNILKTPKQYADILYENGWNPTSRKEADELCAEMKAKRCPDVYIDEVFEELQKIEVGKMEERWSAIVDSKTRKED